MLDAVARRSRFVRRERVVSAASLFWAFMVTCQFSASCSHLKADFCRVMQPPHLQADAATSTRG
jgi:hypothetical protein